MLLVSALFTLVILFVMLGIYQKKSNAICNSRKRLDGQTVLVTGGTSGIGLETAKDIASRGAKVIIACPCEEEGESARTLIINCTGNHNVTFDILNLASLKSVRGFAAKILKTEDKLNILINNAGVGAPGDYQTGDGLNVTMQVNFYGHFLLTLLLLPLLMKSGSNCEPSRIINVSSNFHWFGTTDFTKHNFTRYWHDLRIYGNSKLSLLLFAHELSKRLQGSNVVVNSLHPGYVGTRIFYSINRVVGSIISFLLHNLFKTAWEGAQTTLYVALDEEAGKVSGQYFVNCQISQARKIAYDDKFAKLCWAESVRFVKCDTKEVDQCFDNTPFDFSRDVQHFFFTGNNNLDLP